MTWSKSHSSHRLTKIALRIEAIDGLPDQALILDAFSANGDLWNEVRKQTGRKLRVVRIEREHGMKGSYLEGDNIKWMEVMDLNKFDMIDLDAYGTCFEQLELLRRKEYAGRVVCTWISSVFSTTTTTTTMNAIGVTDEMIDAAPTMTSHLNVDAIHEYVRQLGSTSMRSAMCSNAEHGFRRLYFWFTLPRHQTTATP